MFILEIPQPPTDFNIITLKPDTQLLYFIVSLGGLRTLCFLMFFLPPY